MTKFHLGRGLTEYFLYKGVASGEEVRHKIYICRARAGATKTLGLAAMEWKLNTFFERYSESITSPRVERVYAWRVTKEKNIWQMKEKKNKRDPWFMNLWKSMAKIS